MSTSFRCPGCNEKINGARVDIPLGSHEDMGLSHCIHCSGVIINYLKLLEYVKLEEKEWAAINKKKKRKK